MNLKRKNEYHSDGEFELYQCKLRKKIKIDYNEAEDKGDTFIQVKYDSSSLQFFM